MNNETKTYDELLCVKELIRAKGTNFQEIADKIGIAKGTLSNRLHSNPTLQSLLQIADAIGCEVADLFRVPDGYVHWTQGEDTAPKESDVMICPNCGTKFKIIR